MNIVLMLHSIVRWILVLVALIALVKFALEWSRKARVEKSDRVLMSAFSGMIDLQALLGIIFLFWQGLGTAIGFPQFRIEHAVTMIIAVVIAHSPMAWKKNETTAALRNNFLVVLAVLVVVFIGVAVLPGNRWLPQ